MPTWIRCRDRDTGHEFDLSDIDPRVVDGLVDVLDDYPENSGPDAGPRDQKYRVAKTGRPVRKAADKPAETSRE